jgi:hypothetical protein
MKACYKVKEERNILYAIKGRKTDMWATSGGEIAS